MHVASHCWQRANSINMNEDDNEHLALRLVRQNRGTQVCVCAYRVSGTT